MNEWLYNDGTDEEWNTEIASYDEKTLGEVLPEPTVPTEEELVEMAKFYGEN